MATKAQFQLFPSPVKNKKNPFRTIPGREETNIKSPVLSDTEEDSKSGTQTESVIIKIIEDTNTNSIQPRPAAQVHNASTQADHSLKLNGQSPAASTLKSLPSTKELQLEFQRLQKGTPISPGMPIHSMFPQYNHQLPLDQQAYFPQSRESPNSSQNVDSSAGRAVPTTQVSSANIDAVLVPKTVPASVVNFPSGALSPQIKYSTAEELLALWESANGQELQTSLGTFNLRVERVGTTRFTFGDPQLPFYTLNSGSEGFSLLRNHPLKPNRGVQVMVLNFENPARRQPPHDGLVTVIFSKLAAILAVEQATELSRQHSLVPSEALEVETNAVNRAASQESCRLVWNARHRRYELQHPALHKNHSQMLVGDDGNPLPLVQTANPGILHITVSPSADSESQRPPVIMVTSPKLPNSIQAGNLEATPRTSTLPQADSDEPLASFDLGAMTLSICAGLTTNIIPSLYAIDSLIAAILAVAVTDEGTYPVLANTDLYVPNVSSVSQSPRKLQQQTHEKTRRFRTSLASTAQKTDTTFSGQYFATLAEREDAEEEAKLMSQIRATEKKERSKTKNSSNSTKKEENKKRGFFSFSGSRKKKTKQIVVEEFDLEKYGHYGEGSSREGEELPGIARLLVSFLVFGLQVVVMVLSVGVKCAVWMVVNVARCVTSEKF